MSNLEFLNIPKSPTYRRIYGFDVNRRLLDNSPYQFKHEERYKRVDRHKRPSFAKTLPLRPVDVFDFPPHPSKDVALLFEYYFPESAAEHKTPSVAEMSFIQRKLEEREMEETKKTQRSKKDWSEEGNEEEDSNRLPPLNAKSTTKMESTGSTTRTSQQGDPLPFISVTKSKDHRLLRREWEEMTPGQKMLYSDFVEPTGRDWRDNIRDKIWLSTLERIDERVKTNNSEENNNSDLHIAEVCLNAQQIYENRLHEMVQVQEEKEARQKVAQQNRLTPTQIRKLAVIATKEWKKFDFAKKKQARERKAAAEQRKREKEEAERAAIEERDNV